MPSGLRADEPMLSRPSVHPATKRSAAILLVATALLAAPLGLLLLAEVGGRKCRQQPTAERYVGCLLREHKELAGGLFGAAGTILAGWVAWSGVQRQVKVQAQQTHVATMTFWQAQIDQARSLTEALDLVIDQYEFAAQQLKEVTVPPGHNRDVEVALTAKGLAKDGGLDLHVTPSTQSNLIARLINDANRLRARSASIGRTVSPRDDIDQLEIVTAAVSKFLDTFDEVEQAQDVARADLDVAKRVLATLEPG
jgi:hypothetical protein